MTVNNQLTSIIMPVYNEEAVIAKSLEALFALRGQKEILVVDGGSGDRTLEIAKTYGVTTIKSGRGRARQMNAGAYAAKGDILLFMHGDSRLSPEALETLQTTVALTGAIGGCFKLAMDDASLTLKVVCFMSHLRARFAKIYFGDQGIFVLRDSFIAMGGFPEIELMEDWELSRKMRGRGKLVELQSEITTSARRFHAKGIWKTIWLMQKLKLMYLFGVPAETLRRYYDDVR